MSSIRNPASYASSLQQDASGIWQAAGEEAISYTADGHNLILAYEDSFWYSHRNTVIGDLVVNSGINALVEVGGGNGLVSAGLQNLGLEVSMLEPGLDGILHARSRGLQTLIHASMSQAGFCTDALPNIGLFDVLEHIEDDQAFCAELFRILQPNGKLVVTVPAFQSLYSGFDREVGHYRRYTTRRLETTLQKAGFTIERSGYLFHSLWLPAWLIRKVVNRRTQPDNMSQRRDREHLKTASLLSYCMKWWLGMEYRLHRLGLKLPFGTSCYAIATKTEETN